jgi:hypothetical protein
MVYDKDVCAPVLPRGFGVVASQLDLSGTAACHLLCQIYPRQAPQPPPFRALTAPRTQQPRQRVLHPGERAGVDEREMRVRAVVVFFDV